MQRTRLTIEDVNDYFKNPTDTKKNTLERIINSAESIDDAHDNVVLLEREEFIEGQKYYSSLNKNAKQTAYITGPAGVGAGVALDLALHGTVGLAYPAVGGALGFGAGYAGRFFKDSQSEKYQNKYKAERAIIDLTDVALARKKLLSPSQENDNTGGIRKRK